MSYLEFLLVNHYMDNPDMSNEVDHKSNEYRFVHYYTHAKSLSLSELIQELKDVGVIK